mmetsp:Transcript_8245/g.23519  ORF Transcript_8245/g.23519 Transcript_8245/m.23519 type:complete len:84 (+) Transcript_8245:153-404(+)|eukprot:CAMPEP_0118856904 /NCGR_PEP_ID=MMETSP1163-20130328/4215_1 /TAXON_ID=124430 /ORGANISM="Phaeomonas parva, Strain CCMP2877" /LENGTH=83 /DNA_ID=CAMNT_0006790119 /DNA_START=312 /DNA_END=563 /DNA_ORIENTATION=+
MSSTQTLALYRHMLRAAGRFTQYNFRDYAMRKVKTEFHRNRGLQGEEAEKALAFAREQMELLRRQSTISQLYRAKESVLQHAH